MKLTATEPTKCNKETIPLRQSRTHGNCTCCNKVAKSEKNSADELLLIESTKSVYKTKRELVMS